MDIIPEIPKKVELPVVGKTSTIVIAGVAGFAVGFFLLTGSNCYGAGKWGNSTFGRAYNAFGIRALQ